MSHLDEFKRHLGEAPTLSKEKSPVAAAIWGLLLGAVGIAIYFRSLRDFFVCIIVLAVCTTLGVGVGFIPGWLFAAIYGYFRAESSNKKLRERK